MIIKINQKTLKFFAFSFAILFALYLFSFQYSIAMKDLNQNVTVFSTLLLSAIFLLFVVYRFIFVKKRESQNMYILSMLKIMTLYSYIISIVFVDSYPFHSRSLVLSLLIPLLFFSFMYSIMNRIDNERTFLYLMLCVMIILICLYYQTYQIRFSYFDGDTCSNPSYFILYFLPFVLCIKNVWVRILMFASTLVVLISSAKRGGLICFLFGFLFYLFVKFVMIKNNKKKKVTGFILFGILLLILLSFFSYWISNNNDLLILERFKMMEDGDSSGRDVIYKYVLENMIGKDGVIPFFIGHGFNAVMHDSPFQISAHNDFLEAVYDYGIIYFTIYVLFHFKLIKLAFKMTRNRSFYAPAFIFSYCCFFVNSMVSHILIYNHFFVIFTSFWAMIIVLYTKEQKNNLKS